jgi:hypothetical protein
MYTLCGGGEGDATAVDADVVDGLGDVVSAGDVEGEGDATSPGGPSSNTAARTAATARNVTASAMAARRMLQPYIPRIERR